MSFHEDNQFSSQTPGNSSNEYDMEQIQNFDAFAKALYMEIRKSDPVKAKVMLDTIGTPMQRSLQHPSLPNTPYVNTTPTSQQLLQSPLEPSEPSSSDSSSTFSAWSNSSSSESSPHRKSKRKGGKKKKRHSDKKKKKQELPHFQGIQGT